MRLRSAMTPSLFVCGLVAVASAGADDPVQHLPSPRLGMWWPDTVNQSLDDIARYDFVMLGESVSDIASITGLRARNPDIVLLTSTNACEIPAVPIDQIDSPVLRAWAEYVSMDWLLTQVGTQLTRTVDASETVFHIAQTTATAIAAFPLTDMPGSTTPRR